MKLLNNLYFLIWLLITLKVKRFKQSLPFYKEIPSATYIVIKEHIMMRGHNIDAAMLKRFDLKYQEAISKGAIKYDGKNNKEILKALFEICSCDIIAFPFLRRRLINKGLSKYTDQKINWDLSLRK